MKKQLKFSFLFAALFIVAACFMGCEGDEGPAGPAGATGAAGAAGATGSTGAAGPGYSSVVLTMGNEADDPIGKSIYLVESNKTYNTSSRLFIVASGQFYNSSNNQRIRTLMSFDIAQANLPADAIIVDAILTLYPYVHSENSTGICHFHIYPMSADWSETTCTWNNAIGGATPTAWATAGGGGDYSATTSIGEFSVTPTAAAADSIPVQAHLSPAYVQNWNNGHPNYGFIITLDDEAVSVNKRFLMYSRKATGADATKRPSLRIIYARTSQLAADMSVEGIRAEYQAGLQSK